MPKEERDPLGQAKDFARIVTFEQKGKPVEAPNKAGGECLIRFPRHVTFCGDPAATIRELNKLFPDVAFKFAEE